MDSGIGPYAMDYVMFSIIVMFLFLVVVALSLFRH